MNKLQDMAARRKEAHAKLLAAKSRVYQAFLEMERAGYSDGALSKRQKELIAVGISVATDCESCMQWHIEQAPRNRKPSRSWTAHDSRQDFPC
jgi:AhpD family alkylhydroperoxidase